MKLSTALRVLLVLVVLGVALLFAEASDADISRIQTVWDLVLHSFAVLVLNVVIYVAIEFIGVAYGYIEDDIGDPTDGPDGGHRNWARVFWLRNT